MLFEVNGERIKFNMKNMTKEKCHEVAELIEKNGGEVSSDCDFIFTDPDTYNGEKIAFDIKYIYNCIHVGKILDLDEYIIRNKKQRSCLTMLFIPGGERCNCSTYANLNFCRAQAFIKANRNTTFSTEHDYVTRDCLNESQPKILRTEEMGDTPFSDSIYNPDETQLEQFINRDENVEIQLTEEPGNTQVSDSIYYPDDTQSQAMNEMNMNFINNEIEVPSTNNGPNKRYSFEITRTFETATSSNLNVETNEDVCDIKEESCSISETETETIIRDVVMERTETVQNNRIGILNELSNSSETEAEDIPDKNPDNVEIAREIIKKSPNYQLPKSLIVNLSRLSDTPKSPKPSGLKRGEIRTGLRCKNPNKQTAGSSKVGDTMNLLCDLIARSKSTKKSAEKSPQNTNNSRVISNSDTDYDEVTLNQRQKTQNKRTEFRSETDSDENYSPLIDSDFISDSDSPKSRRKNVRTSLTKKKFSKSSSNEKTAMVTSTKSDQSSDRLSSSNDDSPPRLIRKWKKIAMPSSKQSTLSKSQPTTSRSQQYATRNFTLWEQKEMVAYLIKNNYISRAKGNNVWRQMISDGFLKHRTYQSLQNHFRKSILPNIHRFSMDAKSRAEFKKIQPR